MTTASAEPDASRSALDEYLCFAIYSANLAFGRLYLPLLKSTGLTYLQYVAMVVLWERDRPTVGELCQVLMLTTSTVTPLLQKLETRGLLRRVRADRDERQVRILVTPEGHALKSKVASLPDCIRDASGLEPEALETMQRALIELRRRIGRSGNESVSGPLSEHTPS